MYGAARQHCFVLNSTGIHHSTGPEKCCFAFSENPVPLKRVTRIIKTHHGCQHEAFVVESRVPWRRWVQTAAQLEHRNQWPRWNTQQLK
uniref:Chemokine interleukin-8-like domain-containing protein n=1 Tax=Oryzias latipes TaxID=8090 RepID=A0A3P9M8C7_ORYLA